MTRSAPAATEAAIRLFATFARFEFALKEAGFVRADRSGSALADWDRFTNLPRTEKIAAAIRHAAMAPELANRPPKRQVATGQSWEWQDVEAGDNANSLLRAIRRVRNNLFHGGKSGSDPRDDILCKEAVGCLLAL